MKYARYARWPLRCVAAANFSSSTSSIVGLVVNGIAWIVARLRELRTGRMTRAERDAWREHGRNERYRTWREAQELAATLPGALAKQHLLWRYSIQWTK